MVFGVKTFASIVWGLVALVIFCIFVSSNAHPMDGGLKPGEKSLSEALAEAPTPSSSDPSTDTAPKVHEVGYVGILSAGPHIPVVEDPDDFQYIANQDKREMARLMMHDKLFSADGGAKARIVGRKFPGLVKIEVLSGESKGREGWVPEETVV